MFRPAAAVLLLGLAAVSPVEGATRITHDIEGKATAIAWEPTAFPLRYEIDSRVESLSTNAVAMVGRAFEAWTRVSNADVRFESGGVIAGAAAASGGKIVVSAADDLLRGQGALAVTSYLYDVKSGRMIDADIRVDPSLFDGRVDAEAALQHEVGHLLGLDHSAVLSSVMYPYVGARSRAALDSDDELAIASVYPAGDPLVRGATLQGRVFGDDGGIFAAQVVALNDAGQPVGTVLTDTEGEFVLSGVPPGRYRIYAEPLDGPVSVDSLQGSWRAARGVPFPTRFFGPPIEVANGRIYGNLILSTAGAVRLNPRLVGVGSPGSFEISLSTMAVSVTPGQRIRLTVGGDGFTSGMTTFEVLSPAFRRVSDFDWWDGAVSATFEVGAAAPPSAVILVRSGQESAALTGALQIRQAARQRAVRK